MHKLIPHFQSISLTWLLLPADFASTCRRRRSWEHCSDIVTIGRVKWFEDSKYTSKDNFAWYRFNARHKGVTAIHRRNEGKVIPRRTGNLPAMRRAFELQRSSARFCSETCRQRAHRKRLSVTSVTPAPSRLTRMFRYVRHADVPRFAAEGWHAACTRWHAPR